MKAGPNEKTLTEKERAKVAIENVAREYRRTAAWAAMVRGVRKRRKQK